MTSFTHGTISKRSLFALLGVLRLFLAVAAITVITVEIIEVYMQKEVMHLALFAMFFLICNFQINLSRHTSVFKKEERISRLFILALFSLAAAFFELVDLGFDQLTKNLKSNPLLTTGYQSICVLETAVAILAILLITYSIDRMLVTLRSTAHDHRTVNL
ncbi:hypothetical protein [Synechococcus sp. CS-197]|uniref:hypothetical protein n=1 Tax=Synechococcus sp. CS-197 TaxID=2847985 RepID=UPI0001525C14|nr:hypothetical protein [Synechococcus sp. CS-197]MCT0251478.1 hypothetical protein [Synechococcus sp. CS-197]PTT91022.1 hypothetical protein DBR45_55595 [Pseudomonas sp. HMWF031]CAK24586.1 Uncharacterized membrane protein [Synechococcus sp. WH 7803]